MYKHLQINKETINTPMKKEAKNMNRSDTEEVWVTNEHMENAQPC